MSTKPECPKCDPDSIYPTCADCYQKAIDEVEDERYVREHGIYDDEAFLMGEG